MRKASIPLLLITLLLALVITNGCTDSEEEPSNLTPIHEPIEPSSPETTSKEEPSNLTPTHESTKSPTSETTQSTPETTHTEITPSPQKTEEAIEEKGKLNLSVGQKLRYIFFEEGSEFGYNEYEVVSQEEQQGSKVFTIESTLELDSSNVCKPTTITATLILSETGGPISYQAEASVGSG